jgi:hypothetical protein
MWMVPPSVADLVLGVTPDVICCPFLCHDIVSGDTYWLLLSVSHLTVTLLPTVMGEFGFSTIFSSVADPESQNLRILQTPITNRLEMICILM